MSAVINLLERLGEDATLRGVDLDQAVTGAAQLDPAVKEAIRSGDQRMLEKLLGVQTNVCCGLHPAKEDEEDDGEEPLDDDGDDDSDDVTSQRSSTSRAVSGF